jgi:hypothetical protein
LIYDYQHAVLWVSPKLGDGFNSNESYDRNILFENNLIETFQNRIVWADRLDGLVFKGNTIRQVGNHKSKFPNSYLFDFENCKDIFISNNVYEGDVINIIKTDKLSKENLKLKKNIGFL